MKIVFIIFFVLCGLVFARNAYDRSGNYRGSSDNDNGSYSKQGQYRQIKKTTNVYESSNSHRKNANTTKSTYDSKGRYKVTKDKRGRSDTILIDKEQGSQYRGSQYENGAGNGN